MQSKHMKLQQDELRNSLQHTACVLKSSKQHETNQSMNGCCSGQTGSPLVLEVGQDTNDVLGPSGATTQEPLAHQQEEYKPLDCGTVELE